MLKKYANETDLREVLYSFSLLDYVNLIAITAGIIKKALKSTHKDFEDAIQVISANTSYWYNNPLGYFFRRHKKTRRLEFLQGPPGTIIFYCKSTAGR